MRMKLLSKILLLWVMAAAQAPAWAQVPAAIAAKMVVAPAAAVAPSAAVVAPVLSPAQAQAVLEVLQNDAKRAQFISVLQNIAKVQAATVPVAKPAALPLKPGSLGAELLTNASGALDRASASVVRTTRALIQVTLAWDWLRHTAADPASRALALAAAWRIVLLAGLGVAAQYGVWRLLARGRAALHGAAARDRETRETEPSRPVAAPASSPLAADGATRPPRPSAWGLLRRVPYALLRLLAEMVPLLAFGAVIYGGLATPLASAEATRPLLLALADAYLATAGALAALRALLAPDSGNLRLFHMSDASAAYLIRWATWLFGVAAFGFALDQVGLLFGMYPSVHDALVKVIALALHLIALIMVMRCRGRVARRLRAPAGVHGAWAMLRNRAAELWHVVAIFYIVAVWLVIAFEVPGGYALLWRYLAILLAALIAARLLLIVLLGGLDRALRLQPRTLERFPGLDRRAGRYQPVLRGAIQTVVWLLTGAALLHFWGVPVGAWFGPKRLGSRMLGALGDAALVIGLAVLVWEALNAAIDFHLARLAREAQLARSARLRTLLPMLRTTLLVVIFVFAALTVLSEIGIDTAPLLAGAGVVGIAVGFGSQKLVQDVITGLFLLLENAMQVGDMVALAGLSGTVEALSIRTIRLRATDGSVHVIPFSAVTTVTNSTRDYGYAVLDVSAGYNEEPDHIMAVLREIAAEMRGDDRWGRAILADLEIWGVDKFLDNAWVLRARVKTIPAERWATQREFNRRLKYRFDRDAIESPFTSPRSLSTNPPPPDPDPLAAPEPKDTKP